MMTLPKTYIIYEPKGPAKEYADLALNIYCGCLHRCRYCFGPGVLWGNYKRT
jgi:DNA repair photolyase